MLRPTVIIFAALLSVQPLVGQLRKGPAGKAFPKARNAKKAQLVDRFQKMSPEQRQKALEQLPPERRRQVEANLDHYSHLSDGEKKTLQSRYENFQQLPPERQQAARKVYRQMTGMPQERRVEIRREVGRLGRMGESDRKARLASDEFKGKYSAEEQRVIQELGEIFVK